MCHKKLGIEPIPSQVLKSIKSLSFDVGICASTQFYLMARKIYIMLPFVSFTAESRIRDVDLRGMRGAGQGPNFAITIQK